jgi:hypothetical protein
MCSRLVATLSAAAVLLLSTGCATITTQPKQAFSVSTEPAGAACTITRAGKVVGIVNPTPGSVQIDKSSAHLHLTCEKEGYLASSATAAAQFQAMTLGNILIGGLIGVAVDAASGAMYFYPGSAKVVLIPARFGSAEERDKFFGDLEARVRQGAAQALEKLDKNCQQTDHCARDRRAIESSRDQQLADFERQRLAALIGPAGSVPIQAATTRERDATASDAFSQAVRYVNDHACEGPLQPLGSQDSYSLYQARCGDQNISLRCNAGGCDEWSKRPAR